MLDDADRMLVRLRRFKGAELAAEELRGKEMTVPGGEPPGQHLAIYEQKISRASERPASRMSR